MEFERNKDVKDAIGIGAKQTAREVYQVGVYTVKSFYKKTGRKITMKVCLPTEESHAIRILMGIEAGELRPEGHGIKVLENWRVSKWGPLKYSKGKWLKYRDHFYYIPK